VESKYLRTVTADEFPRRKDAGFRKLACHIAHDWFNARTGMCVLLQAALYRKPLRSYSSMRTTLVRELYILVPVRMKY
jgi:hypothetical protein